MNFKSRCLWLFSVFNENYPQTPICLWIGNYLILPGISIFGINTPLPNASDLWKLWSYVFRKGVQMNIVAGHLDNAGFNAIAKSSLLEKMSNINREKTPLQMNVTASMLSLS